MHARSCAHLYAQGPPVRCHSVCMCMCAYTHTHTHTHALSFSPYLSPSLSLLSQSPAQDKRDLCEVKVFGGCGCAGDAKSWSKRCPAVWPLAPACPCRTPRAGMPVCVSTCTHTHTRTHSHTHTRSHTFSRLCTQSHNHTLCGCGVCLVVACVACVDECRGGPVRESASVRCCGAYGRTVLCSSRSYGHAMRGQPTM